MIKSRIAVAGVLLAVAGAANAGFTAAPALTSDYDFRGLTQTDEGVAGQLGLTFNTEGGAYIGTWASNVEFPGADPVWEIDFFAGFAGGDAEESFAYDVGAVVYAYPSSRDFREVAEVYAGITKGWASGKVWFSPDNYGDTSIYVEGNLNVPLPNGFSIGAHMGYSFGDYWKNIDGEYTDYSLGITKNLGNIALNMKYVDTDIDNAKTDRVIFTVSTTLPWAE